MIDPSIALGVRPAQFESPVNILAQLQNFKNAQTENQLRGLQIENMQTQQADENALNEAYKNAFDVNTGKLDTTKLRANVAGAGLGSKLPAIEKSLAEIDKARNEADLNFNKLVKERMDLSRTQLEGVNPNAPDAVAQYMAWHDSTHRDPVLARYFASLGVTPEQSTAHVQSMIQQPGGLARLIDESKLGSEKALEHIVTKIDTGGAEKLVSTKKYGEASPTEVASYTKTAAPATEGEKAPTVTTVTDPNDPNKTLRIDARTYRGGGAGSPGVLGYAESTAQKLDAKTQATREAVYPQATQAVHTIEDNSNTLISQLKQLRDHKGLSGITGLVAGRTPNVSGESRAAQALLDTVMAKGQFSVLQAMRAASKTGGALGNVSDKEEQALRASFGSLAQTQNTADFKKALGDVIADLERTQKNAREAYDTTYEYRNNKETPATAPAKTAGGATTSNW